MALGSHSFQGVGHYFTMWYGSTMYIGIAMVFIFPYIWKFSSYFRGDCIITSCLTSALLYAASICIHVELHVHTACAYT